MRDIIIKNVNEPGYEEKNLNQIYDPAGQHKREFGFLKNEVFSPYRSGEGGLCVNFYTLMPGKSNYPYHQHFGKKEVPQTCHWFIWTWTRIRLRMSSSIQTPAM